MEPINVYTIQATIPIVVDVGNLRNTAMPGMSLTISIRPEDKEALLYDLRQLIELIEVS